MGNDQAVEINQRLVVLSVSLVLGIMLIAIMSVLFETPGSQVGAFLLDRHTQNLPYPFTIQNVMWLMFCVGCGELWVRFRQSSLELELVSRKYLPEDDEIVLRAQDLGPLYKKASPVEGEPIFFLQRLIRRCILQFQASRSVDQTNSLLNSSLELFQHELELKYNMLRYLVWLIPTLGFIGTVVGIVSRWVTRPTLTTPRTPPCWPRWSVAWGWRFTRPCSP